MRAGLVKVYGVGLNDADYTVHKNVNGKVTSCKYYSTWKDMLKRCYSKKHLLSQPTYDGCYVSEEWLAFSNFKKWMETQDWEGMHLDKDLIIAKNKEYSKDKCAFVTPATNTFIVDHGAAKGMWPTGVHFDKFSGRFKSECCNPFTKKVESLGRYHCPEQAHQAWKKRKHELACKLAELQTDERVANALRVRYL